MGCIFYIYEEASNGIGVDIVDAVLLNEPSELIEVIFIERYGCR
jgi:hypothetical protein